MNGHDLHVAVDMDDVVLEFMPSVLAVFKKEYGIDLLAEYDGNAWGVDYLYKHPALLDSGYKSWWDWLRDRDWLWSTFTAVDGSIGGIKRLRARGHYVELVTSKPAWAEFNVWKWLGKWRPPFNRVTIVTTGQSKLDYTDAGVIVDDKVATVLEFAEAGRRAVLFDRRLVRVNDGPHEYVRVAQNWDDVIEDIDSL